MVHKKSSNKLNSRGSKYCRICDSDLTEILDLGFTPVANSLPYINSTLDETFFPLVFSSCPICKLGQIGEFNTAEEIFLDYPYLSSTSTSWLRHAAQFSREVIEDYPEIKNGYVLELASNDGYLLKNFTSSEIDVLGVDPAENIAEIANRNGVRTLPRFFTSDLAHRIKKEYGFPKLIVANNVAAHVPDIVDFFSGISILCNGETIVTIENPTLGLLVENLYYDTIYHEHFSYLSVESIQFLADRLDLQVFRVKPLKSHGGSFRYYISRKGSRSVDPTVEKMKLLERQRGVGDEIKLTAFARKVNDFRNTTNQLVNNSAPDSIIGYGAAAKSVTTFFAARLDESKFNRIVDLNPLKHGRRLPGTSLPITEVASLSDETRSLLIFPWNLESEISSQVKVINKDLDVWSLNRLRET